LHLAEQDFFSLTPPRSDRFQASSKRDSPPFWLSSDAPGRDPSTGYDYIITLFFIDTSLNIFSTLEHIYHLLRHDGTWINLGPLLWTSGTRAKVELSLHEVMEAATRVGFVMADDEKPRTIECEYTADVNAMMKWIYLAEFWVARKKRA
jgi:hypothetical protein